MKVVLINPISKLAENSKRYRTFAMPTVPLGIASIAAVLEKRGIEVTVIDQYANKMTNKELLKKIEKEMPQIIGFSCLTQVMDNVKIVIEQCRIIDKNIKIILGNIHPTIFTDELLKKGVADIIIRGEGEYSMLETVLALENKTRLENVKGISYFQDKKIYHNPEKEPIEDLDELPYPAWHLLDLDNYTNFPLLCVYDLIIPVQASRGCAYRCSFCSQDKIYKKPRFRKNKEVIDEIEYLHKKFKIRYSGFYDAYFPFSIEQGLEFCNEYIDRGLHKKVKWVTGTRVDKVNLELLKMMKKAGLHLIMYGFESANQNVLDSIDKNATIEQARMAMEYTKKAGILSLGLFIIGMPGETKETCEKTIKFARKLDCDVVKFNTVVPFPGSRLFEEYKTELSDSIDKPEKFTSWYDWSSFSGDLIYVPNSMTSKELVNLQRKGMFQYYVRPRMILRHILRNTISFKNLCYGAFILITNYLKAMLDKYREW